MTRLNDDSRALEERRQDTLAALEETPHWIVVLLGERNPWDGEGALRVVTADTAEEAVRRAHENPPSTLAVKFAWVHRLAEPYAPIFVPANVPKPEWGTARAAR